jgi:hypothetical protein
MTPGHEEGLEPPLDLQTVPARGAVGPAMPLPPQEVADLFLAIDKAVRAQRLYQTNNPVYRGFIAAMEKAFADLWTRVPVLTAAVEEKRFRWYGRAFAAGEGRESLPFIFYKDGIRFITFLPGFEHEVEPFLDLVNRARAQDTSGADDLVTLLWQQEFSCFQYSYVDALAEGLQVPQSTVPKLAGIQLTLVPEMGAEGQPRPNWPPESEPSAVEAGKPSVTGLVNRDDFEETLYFLDPSEVAHLKREVEQEWQRDVKQDVLNAMFDRVEEGLPQWRGEIMRILRQLLPAFLGGGDLRSATRILIELNALVEDGTLTDEPREDAMALFRELSEPAVLSQLLRSLEEGSIDPTGNDLGIFLEHLGPAAMPVLLSTIERNVAGAAQQRLRGAMEGLAAAHTAKLVELLRHNDADVLRGAARLAGQLALAEAAVPLAELLHRSDANLRRVAVEALVRIRNSPALAALQHALDDVDREVRIAAARGVGALRYAPARTRLEEMLESRTVRDADLTEKIAFFEAYGAVANADSVTLLDRLLNGRRLLGKENPETRACAAMALGKVASPAARTALQKANDESNPMVRSAVLKALRKESA